MGVGVRDGERGKRKIKRREKASVSVTVGLDFSSRCVILASVELGSQSHLFSKPPFPWFWFEDCISYCMVLCAGVNQIKYSPVCLVDLKWSQVIPCLRITQISPIGARRTLTWGPFNPAIAGRAGFASCFVSSIQDFLVWGDWMTFYLVLGRF